MVFIGINSIFIVIAEEQGQAQTERFPVEGCTTAQCDLAPGRQPSKVFEVPSLKTILVYKKTCCHKTLIPVFLPR